MKKIRALLAIALSIVIASSGINVFATYLYTEDGRCQYFSYDQVEAQLKVGWYREPVQRLYTADGRSKVFENSKVDSQLNVGWFKTQPIIVYAEDGRTKYIENTADAIAANEAVGWYKEPVQRLYTPDGRNKLFKQSQVAAQVAVGWYTQPVQTLYTIDGRTKVFPKTQVAAQVAVGWSTEPFVTMYAPDGRTKKVKQSQVAANQKVGWFKTKPIKMYAEGGKTKYIENTQDAILSNEAVGWYREPVQRLYSLEKSKLFKVSQVPAQLKVGWFTEPVTKMYAIDGRTKAVPNSQITANQKVGWYLVKDYVIARANVIKTNVGYEPAINFVQSMLWDADYHQSLYNKIDSLCQEWHNKIGCPVAVRDSHVDTSGSYPKAYVYFRNLSTTKAIVAIEYAFTCYDVYGQLAADNPSYSSTRTVNFDEKDFYKFPTSSFTIYSTLYDNEDTRSIKNIVIKKVAFSDGTVWIR